MTWDQFVAAIEAGENPYLMAFDDPSLEPFMERWAQIERLDQSTLMGPPHEFD